jgi:hypothetical protein
VRLPVRGDGSQEIALARPNSHFEAHFQARCEFEEFAEPVEGCRRIGPPLRDVGRKVLLLGGEGETALLEQDLVDQAVQVGVGEAVETWQDPVFLYTYSSKRFLSFVRQFL